MMDVNRIPTCPLSFLEPGGRRTMTDPKLQLSVLPDLYAVCKLPSNAPIPEWATSAAFTSITRTGDELSIVCEQSLVPEGVRYECGWRCLRVRGMLDFSMIGVVKALVTPLADVCVSVFVVSTFDTDYLLVKMHDLEKGVAALRASGHEIQE
jgi:hypothetical protein